MPEKKKVERAVETLVKRMGLSKAIARQRLELLVLRDRCTLDEAAARVTAADEFFAEIEARPQRSQGQSRARRDRELQDLRSRLARRRRGTGRGGPG